MGFGGRRLVVRVGAGSALAHDPFKARPKSDDESGQDQNFAMSRWLLFILGFYSGTIFTFLASFLLHLLFSHNDRDSRL